MEKGVDEVVSKDEMNSTRHRLVADVGEAGCPHDLLPTFIEELLDEVPNYSFISEVVVDIECVDIPC